MREFSSLWTWAAKEQPWWVALHLVLALSVPLVIFGVTSCMEEPKAELASLGVEVDDEELIAAIESVIGPLEAGQFTMEVGQSVHYEVNQSIEMTGHQKASDHLQQILHRTESEDSVTYWVRNVDIFYQDDPMNPEVVETESQLEFVKSSPMGLQPAQVQSLNLLLSSLPLAGLSQDLSTTSEDLEFVRRSYHNLSLQPERLMAPPRAVREREDCGGLEGCRVLAVDLNYDQVDWFEDGSWYKTRHFYRFSSSPPYLGRLLSYCIYQQVPHGGRDYLISQCQVLRDFSL